MRIFPPFFLFATLAVAQLQITTSSVPVATQYQSYSTTLTATGGVPPYTWSVVSSTGVSLPEGMALNASTGIVSAAQVNGQGGYAVTVQVADSSSPSPSIATATLNFGVNSDGSYGGCQMFPPDSIYNQRIDLLPVDTTPSDQIPSGYLGSPIHPDFGHGFYPNPGGIPFMRVPANQPTTRVTLVSGGQIDPAGAYAWPFPAWPNALLEGTSYGVAGDDHHTLILQSSVNNLTGPQTGACTLYETYQSAAVPSMFNAASATWLEAAGVHYVLNSDEIAASADTLDHGAQDSPGIPMVPVLIKYWEVPLGVRHPLRITMPSPTNGWVWPATGCCSGSGPPAGLLYRLKASVNWQAICPPSTNPQAATVLQALQQYGAYMSDHGSAGYIQGVPDVRWDDNDLACIKNFPLSDLEVVDNSALEVSEISGQTKPYVVPAALPNGTLGTAYSATISAVGGNPADRQWSVSSGALPPGLLLDAAAGTISGTPSSVGSAFSFSVTATDSASGYASMPQPFAIGVMGSGVLPDLMIGKTHTGNFKQGETGDTYAITVSNGGGVPSSGTVTVTETVPAGLTLVSIAGTGWTCPAGGNTCTRADALASGASYPAITVTVNVAANASSPQVNAVSVSGGGSGSANTTDSTTIVSAGNIDLSNIGVFRSGMFALDLDQATYTYNANTTKFRYFGLPGDQPVAGDWLGTGVFSFGVFRAGAWYFDLNNNGQFDANEGPFFFGLPGDAAIVGDWTGSGSTKVGVFRCPASGVCTWYLSSATQTAATLVPNANLYNPATTLVYSYGLPGDQPVANNWSGTAKVDQIGVFRCPASGVCSWIVENVGDGVYRTSDPVYSFGLSGDIAVVGDWNDGNQRKRIGVFRSGLWILEVNGTNTYASNDLQASFGLPGDKPVVGKWTMP